MSDENELAEVLDDMHDRARDLIADTCWCAFANILEGGIQVIRDGLGKANGITITCRISTGPWAGSEVAALCGQPLGSGWDVRALKPGSRVLLNFLDGRLDGTVVAVATVPGGAKDPVPESIAAVALTPEQLEREEVHAPPKGVGVRYYMRGAAFVVRLKGTQDGFAGELYIEADDQAASPDGQNGTFIRLVRASDGKFAVKLRDAAGAYVEVHDGTVTCGSPDGLNVTQLSNDGFIVGAKKITLKASEDLTCLGGSGIYLNYPDTAGPPSATNGGVVFGKNLPPGAIAGLADVSKTVFVGA